MAGRERRRGAVGRTRGILCAACLVALALLAVAPAGAQAGTYEVWSCRGPDGEPLSTQAWSVSTFSELAPGAALVEDTCGEPDGALTLALEPPRTLLPHVPAAILGAFALPSGARIAGYTLWRSIETESFLPVTYSFVAGVREKEPEQEADDSTVKYGCASTRPRDLPCTVAGDREQPLAVANELDGGLVDLVGLELVVGCDVSLLGAILDCSPLTTTTRSGKAAELRLFRSRVVVEDSMAPEVTSLSGTLTAGAPLSDIATLVVEGADDHGGIAAATLSIDGGSPQVLAPSGAGGCQEPYTRATPCPATVTRVFEVDAAELAEGDHTASGTLVDAAGNVTSFGPIAFAVAHPPSDGGPSVPPPLPVPRPPPPPPPPLAPAEDPANGTPAVRRPRIELDHARVEQQPGRRGEIGGTLRTRTGRPIAGAQLTVAFEQLGAEAAQAHARRPVTTTRRGRFRVRVGGRGARRVTVAFAPTRGGAPTVTAAAIVRTPVRLTVARSAAHLPLGGRLALRGRLRGAAVAGRGAVVELQAIVSGRWRAVGTVTTGRGGRYRWRYRFRYVTRPTVFSFRAVVRRTPGWPWPSLRSRPIEVRVGR